MTRQEMIHFLEESEKGKIIQVRSNQYCEWRDEPFPDFVHYFIGCELRVKPEPRDIWIWEDVDGALGYRSYGSEEICRRAFPSAKPIRFREVIEGEK